MVSLHYGKNNNINTSHVNKVNTHLELDKEMKQK